MARNLVNFKHHRKGTTPLMEAANCRCGEPVVAKLIAAGADVNDVDDTRLKNTALHYAAMTNRDSLTTETLLEAGPMPLLSIARASPLSTSPARTVAKWLAQFSSST